MDKILLGEVGDDIWNAVDEEDYATACRVERELKHLMKLLDEGNEYYTDF